MARRRKLSKFVSVTPSYWVSKAPSSPDATPPAVYMLMGTAKRVPSTLGGQSWAVGTRVGMKTA